MTRCRPSRNPARIAPVPSTQSRGRPSARAKTLVDPPGTTASAGSASAGVVVRPASTRSAAIKPLTASLTVPSPPSVTTTSTPLSAALRVSAVACPRRRVYSTLRSTSLRSARTNTSRVRSLVVVAFGLTTSNARMRGTVPGGRRAGGEYGATVTSDEPDSVESTTLVWAVRLLDAQAVALAALTVYLLYLDLTADAGS